jgi:hypothetical protein
MMAYTGLHACLAKAPRHVPSRVPRCGAWRCIPPRTLSSLSKGFRAARLGLAPQVEFYFSDSNLPRDNFLKEKVAEDAEGFVDVALLCIFSRMNQLLKSSNKDASKVPAEKVAEVADALEGSTVLTLSEDKTRVRRTEVRAKTRRGTASAAVPSCSESRWRGPSGSGAGCVLFGAARVVGAGGEAAEPTEVRRLAVTMLPWAPWSALTVP